MAFLSNLSRPPCVLHEDEHLLVVNKPAGMNTHAPSPFAGEGIYDWLRHREPRWASLAIIHRLDKETSGVMVFAKTPVANRSLTEQFTQRVVSKRYLLLTDRPMKQPQEVVKSKLARSGERFISGQNGEPAETRFKLLDSAFRNPLSALIEAEPLTGRTHQIRVHAAGSGFPILGDALYGGTPAARVYLHAAGIAFKHPATGEEVAFNTPADFDADSRVALRSALIDPTETNVCRLIHGASDHKPGWYVDRLGDFLLSQSEELLQDTQRQDLARLLNHCSARGAYHRIFMRQTRPGQRAEASPQLVPGEAAPERFAIRENGVNFELSFNEGGSVGLFLDQRDNRRRLLTGHVAAGFSFRVPRSHFRLLNVFAYTCGFSVCAAKAGIHTTSLDLSRKYLDWGKRNFTLNGLDPAAHDFIYGDAFDWLKRLAKKGRQFDVILLDPPTFSQSKSHGVFRAEKDYAKLVKAALPLLKADGVLFASTNAADWRPEACLGCVEEVIRNAGKRIVQQHYVPQPPDFPITRNEPAYLKTVWLRMA